MLSESDGLHRPGRPVPAGPAEAVEPDRPSRAAALLEAQADVTAVTQDTVYITSLSPAARTQGVIHQIRSLPVTWNVPGPRGFTYSIVKVGVNTRMMLS